MQTHFSRRTAFYLWHGLAPSTRKSYSSGQRSFLNFVAINPALQPVPGLFLPSNTTAIAEWMAYLADRGLKPTTIGTYLSSVRYLHVNAGIPAASCYSPILQQIYRGIKSNAIHQPPRAPMLPITLAIPQDLARKSAGLSLLKHTVFNTVIKLAWPGFLRRNEFTVFIRTAFNSIVHSSRHHPSLQFSKFPSSIQPTHMDLYLLNAKRNSFRAGGAILVAFPPPDAALRASVLVMRRLLQRSKIEVFHGTTRKAHSRPYFNSLLKSQSRLVLINPDQPLYSGHNFRRGASTFTAALSYKDCEIPNQLLGLWHNNIYKLFIDTYPARTLQLSSRLHVAQIVLFSIFPLA